MTLMDSLSVWYSAGLEAIRLSQVQVQLLLGFIARDNLQVCYKCLQMVLCCKCMFDETALAYGDAAHTSEQTDGSPSPFYREDILLVLTIGKFPLQSCQCALPEPKKEVEDKLFEDGTIKALVAVRFWFYCKIYLLAVPGLHTLGAYEPGLL